MIRFNDLRERFLADTGLGASGATPVLARGLERIGWHAVQSPSSDELADYLVFLLDACVHEHRNVDELALGIAAVLRDAGPELDGGLPPVEAYMPAAEELLRLYVDNDPTRAPAQPT